MMTNLFSTFDPSTNIMNLSINWLSSIIGFFMLPAIYWFMPSRIMFIINKINSYLYQEFKMLLGNNNSFKMLLMFISILMMMVMNNFMGLFPYIFTSTSHLTMTLTIALPLWTSFMLYGWIINTNNMFSHLVPQGTPNILMPFMVLIETTSNIIRPGTLAVRLSANMIAGHLLLTLMGNTGPMISYKLMTIMLIIQLMLVILESAVAVIQGYVFSVLSILYSSEVH
uniref:ATP synthase F0 subunit 6 n=1 Tax=Phytomastax pentaspinula TaxID=3034359 RepID=UPI002411846E|nr:ATP synthase F0 subunit 6 [Phytomastax pentaspinula]WEL32812.1 ATP synthase F0 subunit 6 [Phytomastax pentaspinula]